MADRYWVGGSGTWDTTSTTNWSATSGGAGGASVPTAADSVFFDQPGSYSVTVTGAVTCLDFTVSAGSVIFNPGTSPTPTISGSMTLSAGTTSWSANLPLVFNATSPGKTVTTNGVVMPTLVTFNGIGGAWTLGSAFTLFGSSGVLTVTAGTFDTSAVGNYSVTTGQFAFSGTSTRALSLNASTVTCTTTVANSVSAISTTNLTVNAGTSTIVISGATGGGVNVTPGGFTFYNVTFTSTAATTHAFVGGNTFNSITVSAPATAGVKTVTFDTPQSINGVLSTTGTAGNRRVAFRSNTQGLARTLTINGSTSLTDADFRDIYVVGTAAPISGTRIGDQRGNRGITFSAPKTVYWNLATGGLWTANAWAATSGGAVSTDNFPLAQDTAVFQNTGLNTSANVSLGADVGTVDMSARTNAMSLALSTANIYGNWINGLGTSITNAVTLTFSGRNTQTITSAGKTFSGPITIDSYGGTVQLADALDISSNFFTLTNGTFNTAGFSLTAAGIVSSNTTVRTMNWGSSTVTCTGGATTLQLNSTNLTFNAGTSTFVSNSGNSIINITGGVTLNNLIITSSASIPSISGVNTFNNVTVTPPASAGITILSLQGNQTITGTLTCAGASPIRRVFVRSNTLGVQRDLTVGTLVADDCDFRDIDILGAAAGTAPARAGNCGGNAGITFPAPKTVYWNLAGTQSWSATGWATTSGGTPGINNFPLAQDTAVFNNAGSADTVQLDAAWNIGTFNAAARTTAMTYSPNGFTASIYGDWLWGSGTSDTSTGALYFFEKNGTQTITSNGVSFLNGISCRHPLGVVQIADAISLSSISTLAVLTSTTFRANTYNVTTGLFSATTSSVVNMGSGTWTLSGTGTVWSAQSSSVINVGTSNIVLSDNSTTSRAFGGGGLYYPKLTIGGSTSTSTTTISGNNTFAELASTKTVAHTIAFGTTTQTFGKWSVTGSAGNVVTLTGTDTNHVIAGPAVTGVDYLAMGSIGFSTTSPGEFYAGANSTGTAAEPVFRTAAPTPRTLYWVGGTGNWSNTARWSLSSGGAGGAAVPTSLDSVIFNSASSAAAYTVTIDISTARCASFTMNGPASGSVTFAGFSSAGITFHGSVFFAATGVTRTYTGTMQWAGNASYTFTTNGISITSSVTLRGIGATWTLGSALTLGFSNNFTVQFGTFNTSASNYAVTVNAFNASSANLRSVILNGSTVAIDSTSSLALALDGSTNLTWNAGTSTILLRGNTTGISCGGLTFNNVQFTNTVVTSITITGANTFNSLSFPAVATAGVALVTFSANQTINTLTLAASSAASFRTMLASSVLTTQRTLAVSTFTAGAANYDFRDIAITGAAAPISGTRFGDCKGNSGITFPAPKTVYFRGTGNSNWGTGGTGVWSATSGGTADATMFPLAQDTAVFPAATYPASGSSITVNANYNLGTVDMSLRTTNTMTLATVTNTPVIYGSWINGTGTTVSGSGRITFAGRTSQTITSAGKTFTTPITINTPGGSVTLQDALTVSSGTTNNNPEILAGTFNANNYNVTLAGTGAYVGVIMLGSQPKTVAVGSGTWTFAGSGSPWSASAATNLTVTGTGTFNLTGSSTKSFSGGGISYSGITLNQGGAGQLTITGNNTFKTITNTYKGTGATSIFLGNTTQTFTEIWAASGELGRILSLDGSSATLIFNRSGTAANANYLSIGDVRAYPLASAWYAGANSTNIGSLGWIFENAGSINYDIGVSESASALDAVFSSFAFSASFADTATVTDQTLSRVTFRSSVTETGTGTDAVSSRATFRSTAQEAATGTDAVSSIATFISAFQDSATGADVVSSRQDFGAAFSDTATGADQTSALAVFTPAIAESGTGVDTVAALATMNSALVDSATGTDQASAAATFRSATTETGAVTDQNAASVDWRGVIAETGSGTDSVLARAVFAPLVSEFGTGVDTVSARAEINSALTDSATGADQISPAIIFPASTVETSSITDQNAASAGFAGAIIEVGTGADEVSAQADFASNLLELATGTEQIDPQVQTFPSIAEVGVAVDSASAAAVFPVLVTDTTTIFDVVSAGGAFNPAVLETATVTDAFTNTVTYFAAVFDSAVTSDSFIGAFLWNVINDSQNTNWGSVSTAQNGTWAQISAAQAATWSQINDTQAPGWTGVDDNQNPGWQNTPST